MESKSSRGVTIKWERECREGVGIVGESKHVVMLVHVHEHGVLLPVHHDLLLQHAQQVTIDRSEGRRRLFCLGGGGTRVWVV